MIDDVSWSKELNLSNIETKGGNKSKSLAGDSDVRDVRKKQLEE
jgi:hypothetical protein